MVQWLRLHASNAGGGGLIPVWELRSHMPQSAAKRRKKKKKKKKVKTPTLLPELQRSQWALCRCSGVVVVSSVKQNNYNKAPFKTELPHKGFPGGSVVKNPPASAGHAGSIPGSGRSPGEGNGNPLQDSCLQSSMDRGARGARVQGVTKSRTEW